MDSLNLNGIFGEAFNPMPTPFHTCLRTARYRGMCAFRNFPPPKLAVNL